MKLVYILLFFLLSLNIFSQEESSKDNWFKSYDEIKHRIKQVLVDFDSISSSSKRKILTKNLIPLLNDIQSTNFLLANSIYDMNALLGEIGSYEKIFVVINLYDKHLQRLNLSIDLVPFISSESKKKSLINDFNEFISLVRFVEEEFRLGIIVRNSSTENEKYIKELETLKSHNDYFASTYPEGITNETNLDIDTIIRSRDKIFHAISALRIKSSNELFQLINDYRNMSHERYNLIRNE